MIDIKSKRGIFRLVYGLIGISIILAIISMIFYFTISVFIESNSDERVFNVLLGAIVAILFTLVAGVTIYGLDVALYHVFKHVVEDKSDCDSLYILIAKIIENNIKE